MSDGERQAAAAAQLVEHIDADGKVIAVVTRAEMRARALRHRSVYIAVLDSHDRLLVHKRAPWKDVFPGAWDLAFGGVCDVGEPWQTSAERELLEEAGVSGELRDCGPVHFDAPGVALIGRLYVCRHDGPFSFDDGEVSDAQWVSLPELVEFVRANTVPPDSAQIVTVAALSSSSGAGAGVELESRNDRQPSEEPQLTTDLTAASVRPSGRDGMAARTAAGFVALGSADAAPLFTWIDEHQHSSDLIEGLATEITANAPDAFSMLFTAGGQPWLLAWGGASTLIDGPTARFVISPTDGKLLVHELGSSAEDASIVMSTAPIGDEVPLSPIELSEGSMPADTVSIALSDASDDDSLIVPLVAPRSTTPEPSAVTPAAPPQAPLEPDDAPTELPTDATPSISDEPEPQVVLGGAMTDFDQPVDITDAAAPIDIPIATPLVAPLIAPSVPPEFAPPAQSPFSSHVASDAVAAPAPEAPQTPEAPQAPEVPQAPEAPEPPAVAPSLAPPAAPPLGAMPAPPGPAMVLGVACPQGHHNHPDAVYCSQCGTKMGVHQTTVLVNGVRPPLGVLVVDDGTTFSIDQDLIVGRDAPSHGDVRAGSASPMMLSDDSLALSRHHARIRLDEWSVFVTDLGSSNGTWFSRGSTGSWNRVSPDQSIALEAGDRLRVGGRVIQVELHHIR